LPSELGASIRELANSFDEKNKNKGTYKTILSLVKWKKRLVIFFKSI